MKRKFLFINETGGYFAGNEEQICKEYCKVYGYTYRVEYINIGYWEQNKPTDGGSSVGES